MWNLNQLLNNRRLLLSMSLDKESSFVQQFGCSSSIRPQLTEGRASWGKPVYTPDSLMGRGAATGLELKSLFAATIGPSLVDGHLQTFWTLATALHNL